MLSTCEHYGLHDGPGGTDKQTPYNLASSMPWKSKYKVGPRHRRSLVHVLVPELARPPQQATTPDGTPMKNWWVYLYYDPERSMKSTGWLLGAAILLTAWGARANGRYPLANQLVVGPSDPSHIAIRTTFGLVVSSDHGSTWSWICEKAAGFVNGEDPPIEMTETIPSSSCLRRRSR